MKDKTRYKFPLMHAITNYSIRIIIHLISIFILAMMLMCLAGVGIDFFHTLKDAASFKGMTINNITNILNILILVEIFRAVISYLDFERIKLTFVADATMVFILREVMIAFLEHSTTVYSILGYAALILSIGIVRTMCVVYSVNRKKTNSN
ncbi:MAG: phosphate-starvation-inducible PsiE family protein [Desulfurellaceae bacterium]|nr:phosphate-starvation-inducible PsiE family protein [Desulfurellaceae bacterium]